MKKAVGLKYDRSKNSAPKVIASAKGKMAEKIIELAKKNDIPIKEDSDLVELLSKIEINKEVPPNLYKAVAEVFSWLYKLTGEKIS